VKYIYKRDKDFCYYYAISLLNKEDPNVKKGIRFLKRAKKRGYEIDNEILLKYSL
jgi:hypothetical protein